MNRVVDKVDCPFNCLCLNELVHITTVILLEGYSGR